MTTWQDELFQLNEQLGRLTPIEVLEYAKNPDTALHHQFEWDDTVAASRYRLDQARYCIRRVTVAVTNQAEPTKTLTIRAFSHVPSDGVGVYRPTTVIIGEKKDELLEEITRTIRSWVRKHRVLLTVADIRRTVQLELDNLFDELDESA
jgi:hypothetical protein